MMYKYCDVCGHANNADNKFCESCGNDLNKAGGAFVQSPVVIRKRNRGKPKIIGAIILGVLILAGGGVFAYFHFFSYTTVDLMNGIGSKVLELDGYNGEGAADINRSKIYEIQGYDEAEPDVKKFLNTVKYSTDKEGERSLSNGDKVCITATFEKEFAEKYRIEVKDAKNGKVEKAVVIKGLSEKPEEEAEEQTNYSADESVVETDEDSEPQEDINNDPYEEEKRTTDNGAYYKVSEQRYTEEEISGWDRTMVQRHLNYIYAKHGYKISNRPESRKQREYFESLSWYNKTPKRFDLSTENKCVKEIKKDDIEYYNWKLFHKKRDSM